MNPNTMTFNECRDAIFVFLGGRLDPDGVWRASVDRWPEQFTPPERLGVDELIWHTNHPIPPTLDAAAAAMPEGWNCGRGFGLPVNGATTIRWIAWNGGRSVEIPDTGNEKLDRFRLAVASRMAAKKETNRE